MRYFNKTTSNPPTWSRGQLIGQTSQLSPSAGARPLFSDPLDEEVYETRFDHRAGEFMNVKETVPTDKGLGGADA